jgi:hypothetical protein
MLVLPGLILVIVLGLLYLAAQRWVHITDAVEYEVTLVDDDEEDGAW